MSTEEEHTLGFSGVPPAVRAGLLAAILLLAPALAGCIASGDGEGIVVTGQPAYDALVRLGAEDQVVGMPDWLIVDAPTGAERLGRPFSLPAEEVLAVEPRVVLDNPHPLTAGPERQALASALDQAGVPLVSLPTAPRLSTVHATLQAAGEASGHDPAPAWQEVRDGLAALNRSLEGLERPKALVLFPAGLTAGVGTDVDLILELAGLTNVAAEAGLEGYRAITSEAISQQGVDLVIVTATMRQDPITIAKRPMFRSTAVEQTPERVLVVDPSRTTRVGPYVHEAARMLAGWAHEELDGPRMNAWFDPSEGRACEQVALHTLDDQAVEAHLAGTTLGPGELFLPALPPGHYRVPVYTKNATQANATDPAGGIDLILTVEANACEM